MFRLSLFSFFFIIFHLQSEAQWQYGVNAQATRSQAFEWNTGPILDRTASTGVDYWIEYRFNEKERGPFSYQDGIRTDIQLILRNSESNTLNSQWLRLPLWWTRTMPRRIDGEKHPIFELNTGIGYYSAKPLAVGGRKQNFSTHGFITEAGLAFYIQTGSRINVNYRFAMDFGTFGAAPDDVVQRYIERGLTIGFSSSFPDTKVRLKAMRKWQKERRAKRKGRRNRI